MCELHKFKIGDFVDVILVSHSKHHNMIHNHGQIIQLTSKGYIVRSLNGKHQKEFDFQCVYKFGRFGTIPRVDDEQN